MTSEILGVQQIMRCLPHRYPFLLVDRLVELTPLKRAVGIKCVSANEPFFAGHFPDAPVMPGVLVVEALAQVAAMLVLYTMEDRRDKLLLFGGIDECRFRRPVVPGDVLRLEVETLQLRPRAARMKGVAKVDGEVAAEAVLLSTMTTRSAL